MVLFMKTVTVSKKETGISKKKKEMPDVITQLERSLKAIEEGRVMDARDL